MTPIPEDKRGWLAVLAVVALGGAVSLGTFGVHQWVQAADHVDSPMTTGDQAADIADVYSFQDGDDLVLAMTISNVQAVPEIELGRSIFDPNVLYQFEIDQDGDAVEDQVIQAVAVGSPDDQFMEFRGPAEPEVTGTEGRLLDAPSLDVRVSTGTNPVVAQGNGLTAFAGVRDDPFFFDFGQFTKILAGDASGFEDPGTDSFAGLNVYAIVVEVPLARLGGDASQLAVWGTTSRP